MTARQATPALPYDSDLADTLDDLAGIHPGIDLIRTGLHTIATAPLTADRTQTLVATLAGSAGADVITAIAHLITHLTTPTTNPALTALPLDQQKETERQGQLAAYALTDPDLHQPASEASAAITGT